MQFCMFCDSIHIWNKNIAIFLLHRISGLSIVFGTTGLLKLIITVLFLLDSIDISYRVADDD